MPCFHPKTAYITEQGYVVFDSTRSDIHHTIQLPCNHCEGCYKRKAQEWAIRMVHEAKMHRNAWFLTNTYDDEHLRENVSVCVRDAQLYMKRLRETARKSGEKLRFALVGEYGGQTQRPHYHQILYGLTFPDLKYWKGSGDKQYFRSELLEKTWGLGQCLVAPFTPGTAAYVASYVATRDMENKALERVPIYNASTGETFTREPGFMLMSRRPGIAYPFLEKYHRDITYDGFIALDGRLVAVPDYYVEKLETDFDPEKAEAIKKARFNFLAAHPEESTWERMEVKEEVARAARKNKNNSTF